MYFIVSKFEDVSEKIIPFLDKSPIIGVKALDYADFKKVVEIMRNKGHLSDSGLDLIKTIKKGMNMERIHD